MSRQFAPMSRSTIQFAKSYGAERFRLASLFRLRP